MPSNPSCLLVVDDNPATLYSTSRVLKSAGFRVLEAGTGREAIDQAQKESVDLVVLDVNLPDIDGFEVCRRLRTIGTLVRTPVIHLSATFVKDADKVQGLERGADGYLTHPVEPPVLIATVNAFLRTREAERECRQRDMEYSSIFENALNGIAIFNEEFVFVDLNPAMRKILNAARETIINRSIFDFTLPERRADASEIIRQLQQEGTWRGTFPLKMADSRTVHLEWSISRHSIPNRWLAMLSDITARVNVEREREELLISERSARTEAERANRLKDDFLATLSHELRTPLNAIVGFAQLLKMGQLDEEEARNAVEAIDRNAKAQAQLIADLLDVSRIASGKIRLDVQPVNPALVIEAALETVLPAATAKEIRMVKVLDPHAGPVSGDPGRLQQVIWNLISNSVKFTPKGGEVRVTLARIDSSIEICVADNGQGISPEMLTVLFERFRQGDASTTRSERGLGLGLAIAKQLVEMHGGTIEADSPGPGKGSTFRILLPLSLVGYRPERPAVAGASVLTAADASEAASQLAGVRVLIVDDDADARHLTKRVLTNFGAESQVAEGTDSAMSVLDNFNPHVLVSDLGMPTVDGFQLIRVIRARGYTSQKLPAIALTAFASAADRRRTLLAGYQLHLIKPVDPAELSAAIASLVGRTS